MKVSGLDVHKDTIFCAIYDGRKYGEVIEFTTFSENIREMAHMLHEQGVNRIAMESTGIYWIPVWNILEDAGFDLMLVNPFLIKQMPGRKSDVKDAQWIAKLLTVVWHVLQEKEPFNALMLPVYDPKKIESKMKYHRRELEKLEALGFSHT